MLELIHHKASLYLYSCLYSRLYLYIKADGSLELDDWSAEQRFVVLHHAMRFGRSRAETEHAETARLHRERLPALRANEQQFRVSEEKTGGSSCRLWQDAGGGA